MFNVCCGEFSSIGSIVRESVGQFNSLVCYSGIWWRRRSLLTSSSTFCRLRGKRWRSNLPALQDVLLWLLPMMAFSWFITKVPPEQGHQVWQRRVEQKKWPNRSFLAYQRSLLNHIGWFGSSVLIVLIVSAMWSVEVLAIVCFGCSAVIVSIGWVCFGNDVRFLSCFGTHKWSTGRHESQSWGMDRAMPDVVGRTEPCVKIMMEIDNNLCTFA